LAGELAIWINSNLVILNVASDEILRRAEIRRRVLEGADCAVVADVQVLATELQLKKVGVSGAVPSGCTLSNRL
jgi:hypothetical protein